MSKKLLKKWNGEDYHSCPFDGYAVIKYNPYLCSTQCDETTEGFINDAMIFGILLLLSSSPKYLLFASFFLLVNIEQKKVCVHHQMDDVKDGGELIPKVILICNCSFTLPSYWKLHPIDLGRER